MATARIKVKDTVLVITGKNRGSKGAVTQVLPKDDMIVIDGVNKMYKHVRAQKKGDKGQRIEFWGPIPTGKVMLICPKCSKPTRARVQNEKGKRTRLCKKCNAVID